MVILAIVALSGLVGAQPAPGEVTISVDLNMRHQTIDGFGTCLISWNREMERLYGSARFRRIYTQDVGCSMLRVNLWGPVMPEPVTDWRDIRYQDFVLSGEGHRARMFIDAARGFRQLDPELRVIGTVWSPPAWMKENNSINGRGSAAIDGSSYTRDGRTHINRVNKEYYPHFAKWMVEMVKLHRAEGVPLYAISPGNEVMFTQGFESCLWSAEDYADIVALLGRMLKDEGLEDVLVFGPETMTSHNWAPDQANALYIRRLKQNPDAWNALDVFATHGYTDGFTADLSATAPAEFWRMIAGSGKRFWITEGGTGSHDWPKALHGFGGMLHHALVGGNASAIVPWQITDEKANSHGLMVRSRMTPKTRVAQHYFRFIRPGAARIGATPSDGDVPASAYYHAGAGRLTIVLTNPTSRAITVHLRIRGAADLGAMRLFRTAATESFLEHAPLTFVDDSAEITLPAESLVTLTAEGVKQDRR